MFIQCWYSFTGGFYFLGKKHLFAAHFKIKKQKMKKLTLILALGLFATAVNAQDKKEGTEFKPFKVDVSLGYAIPGGSGAKGGLLFVVEPKYAVIPNLSVGLRIEAAVMARGVETSGSTTSGDIDVKASGSYLATGDYYLSNNYSFRPFVGAGLGIYTIAAASANSTTTSAGGGSKFGEMVRAGFEASHFRLGLEYNIVPKTTMTTTSGSTTYNSTSKNGYIGIKLGVCFGGGRR
jgi:outer membrane protein W